jgi:hypothetical protein
LICVRRLANLTIHDTLASLVYRSRLMRRADAGRQTRRWTHDGLCANTAGYLAHYWIHAPKAVGQRSKLIEEPLTVLLD